MAKSNRRGHGAWGFAAAIGLIALAAVLIPAAARADEDKQIAFDTNLGKALAKARENHQVTVVYFHAAWCQWCRKMAVNSFTDRRVTALAGRFVWVKVDIDADPLTALRYGVNGVPDLVLLSVDGQTIEAQPGYQTADQVATLLRRNLNNALADGKVKLDTARLKKELAASTQPELIGAAVEILSRPDRNGREEMLDTLAGLGPAGWDGLLAAMGDKRLACRAAAGVALGELTGADLPFDPFETAAVRGRQIAAWSDWAKANRGKATTRPDDRPARAKPATAPAE